MSFPSPIHLLDLCKIIFNPDEFTDPVYGITKSLYKPHQGCSLGMKS